MPGPATSARAAKQTYAACSGCSLCLLVCPVWRHTRDLRLTPHGRAKALQHGATVDDIAASIDSCTLCGACEPVCPENIDLVGMVLDLRRKLPPLTIARNLHARMQAEPPRPNVPSSAPGMALLAGPAYFWRPPLLARISTLLGQGCRVPAENDNGGDIALALESGAEVPPQRIERFLAPLRRHKTIVVSDGLLLRALRGWLPRTRLISLGAALSGLAPLRRLLRAGDLYVIEPRAYHADYETLVTHYDDLRTATGCMMSLDLQRIAIPATASPMPHIYGHDAPANAEQMRWLLKGRPVSRIVIENDEDRPAFEHACAIPVVHLAELADDEPPPDGTTS